VIFDHVVVGVEDSESVGSDIWVRFFFVEFDLPVLVGLDDFWGV